VRYGSLLLSGSARNFFTSRKYPVDFCSAKRILNAKCPTCWRLAEFAGMRPRRRTAPGGDQPHVPGVDQPRLRPE
jgi:hypothetical protein